MIQFVLKVVYMNLAVLSL